MLREKEPLSAASTQSRELVIDGVVTGAETDGRLSAALMLSYGGRRRWVCMVWSGAIAYELLTRRWTRARSADETGDSVAGDHHPSPVTGKPLISVRFWRSRSMSGFSQSCPFVSILLRIYSDRRCGELLIESRRSSNPTTVRPGTASNRLLRRHWAAVPSCDRLFSLVLRVDNSTTSAQYLDVFGRDD